MKGKIGSRLGRSVSTALTALTALFVAACGGGNGSGGDSGPTSTTSSSGTGGTAGMVSYAASVAPLFNSRCVDCHHAGVTNIPNLENPFQPGNGLIHFPNTWHASHPETPEMNVVPGDPDNSFLMQKIEDASAVGAGDFMPWSPARLTDDERASLRQWISDGALDDAYFATAVRPIFGNAGQLGAAGGKCSYCHHAGGEEPNLSDPFDPQTGLVGVPATIGSMLRVAPGDPDNSFLMLKVTETQGSIELGAPMPLVYSPLNASQVATIRQWIAEGAQDN